MCGLTGFLSSNDIPSQILHEKVKKMNERIIHRGPDSDGIWISENIPLAFGFRRLAIQDLSPAGAQPMVSVSGRYVIVFNGEVYNFRELRAALPPQNYKGHSDTEVILAAIEEWGIEKTLGKMNGMFAIAFYDQKERVLTLARDRMGKKPLYAGWGEDGFYFASELKAICAGLSEKPSLDKDVMALYLRWRYIPAPYSIYRNIYQLKPGTFLSIQIDRLKNPFDLPREMTAYWAFDDRIASQTPFEGSYEEAKTVLIEHLKISTRRRMIADVPLGAFLSGGVDSSLIVALMTEVSDKKVQTYTIAFDDKTHDESAFAKEVSDHLGTDHTVFTVTGEEALKTVDYLPDILDEPFGDPSIIPTYHVCAQARKDLTVALSGDGGDETFGGYGWYKRTAKLAPLLNQPAIFRILAAQILQVVPIKGQAQRDKMALILSAGSDKELYSALHSYWDSVPLNILNFGPKSLSIPVDEITYQSEDRLLNLMAYDTQMFLPHDVLTKVDRASMAVSLEVRAPLLDYEIVEFGWSLPVEMRRGKKILKDVLRNYVPDTLIHRPKQGFSIPHGAWLRGELREWAEDLLSKGSLRKHGFLNESYVHMLWQDHISGHRDYGHYLWTLVQFQAWAERWL